MSDKEELKPTRTCLDCGKDISHLHHNAKRCRECSKKRKQIMDQKRHEQKRGKEIRWHFFVENPETKELSHRNAKGTRLRYWLDKICKELTVEELNFILMLWDWRDRQPDLTIEQKREYRTCAGIVRDWRDHYLINQMFDTPSFDSETGVIFNSDGSYLSFDFDEENEVFLVRNSEGTIICKY